METPRPRPPGRPGPPTGRLLLLLLLLLRRPVPGRASPRLLDQPPPSCSQQELRCSVTNSTCLDESWVHPRNLTPSSPRDIQVNLSFAHMGRGDLVPVLQVTWTLQTDASVLFLEGAELSVLQLNTNERLCVKFEFLSRLRHHRRRWRFSFSHFVVEPGQDYEVTVHHLPKPVPDGDPNHQSRNVLVPDCEDPNMKITTLCVSSGSLWSPNTSVDALDAHRLQVSFTLWDEPAPYQVLLSSFSPTDNQTCFQQALDVPAPTQGDSPRQTSVTFTVPNMHRCCRHRVQIQPFFSSCRNDCFRRSMAMPCPESPPPTADPAADSLPLWAYGLVTGVSVLLVASAILLILCMTWRGSGSHRGKHGDQPQDTDAPPGPGLTPPPLRPRKVWLVYSADHPLYVDVVLKFAQFLLTVCGTEVALDLLEEQLVSEVGVVAWVSRQKQAMLDSQSKILVLCSRGTRAKWEALVGRAPAVRLRCERATPAGDLFTAAMNAILPDFGRPGRFGTYVVCYFSDVSGEADVPELFGVVPRYPLMSRLEEAYFRIQDLEMFGPGRRHRVGELEAGSCLRSPGGRPLRDALDRFRAWQARCPDWFERETLSGAEDPDLSSLDEDVFEEPPPAGRIMRQQPVLREPGPEAGLRVPLLGAPEGAGAARLQPHPQPRAPLAAHTLQTTPLGVDAGPPAQAVAPVDGEDSEDGRPRRHSVLPTDPAPPPEDSRQRLEGLMLSLFRQSLGWDPRAAPGEQDEERQRQSVQSDQGYISRGSPQPPDGLLEAEAEKGAADALERLRVLQQRLFLRELQEVVGEAGMEAGGPWG